MTNEELLSVAEIVERLVARFHKQADDHEAKMVEHRAAFGVRTEADAKIIAGLREELNQVRNSLGIQAAKEANKVLGMVDGEGLRGAAERVVKERDGFLTQVQDMRAEMERLSAQLGWERAEIKRLQWENATMHKDAEDGYAEAIKVLGDPIALSKERDALRAEVAELKTQLERLTSWAAKNQAARETLQTEIERLKSQTPKHPVKVGEWVTITIPTIWSQAGDVAKVLSSKHVGGLVEYEVQKVDGDVSCWRSDYCDPCDPPNHDTEAGKAVAEAAVKTEPVADDIKVGDLVEVVSNRGRNTWRADVGSLGTVTSVEEINDSISVRLDDVPGKQNALAGYVSLCDVRKVTT